MEARLTDISSSVEGINSVHILPSPPPHVSDHPHCLYNPVSISSVSLTPSTDFSHLLDTLVRPYPARSQKQYLLGSQPLSSPQAGPSTVPATGYTSVGFKARANQIKAWHSTASVSAFYSIRCRVYWQTADGATCLPLSEP